MPKYCYCLGLIIGLLLFAGISVFAEVNLNTKYANPDTSVNFLTLYQNSSRDNEQNGFSLQEAEIQFISDVDAYFRANALFSVSRASPTSEFGIEPEEIYIETIDTHNVTFKIGKFKAALNKQNLLHTHALAFLDAPLIDQQLAGEEGLNEVGVSAALLLPTRWFSELTLQALQGQNEALFYGSNRSLPVVLLHARNLWDISDELTLDLGITGAYGSNSHGGKTLVKGSDVVFKWRPIIGGKYRSLIWTSEYLSADMQNNPNGEMLGGISTWIQYQFAERFWVQARYDNVDIQRKQSVFLGYLPTEYSGFRLQYDRLEDGQPTADNKFSMQVNISIGVHPAHSY